MPVPSGFEGGRRVIRRSPAPASSYDDDTPPRRTTPADDAPPTRTRRPSTQAAGDDGLILSGWAGKKKILAEMPSDFAPRFTVAENKTLIKFLEEGPAAIYRMHWAEWLPAQSKLSYVCRQVDCPICDIGDKARSQFVFNILDLADPESPRVAVLTVGIKVSNLIEAFSSDRPTTPINRPDVYFTIYKTTDKSGSKSRSGGTTQTNIAAVKARDLVEDFDIDPFTADELSVYEEAVYLPEQIITISSVEELQRVADAYQ